MSEKPQDLYTPEMMKKGDGPVSEKDVPRIKKPSPREKKFSVPDEFDQLVSLYGSRDSIPLDVFNKFTKLKGNTHRGSVSDQLEASKALETFMSEYAPAVIQVLPKDEKVESVQPPKAVSATTKAAELPSEGLDPGDIARKLDMARDYIKFGDIKGAQGILMEVLQKGNDKEKKEAEDILKSSDSVGPSVIHVQNSEIKQQEEMDKLNADTSVEPEPVIPPAAETIPVVTLSAEADSFVKEAEKGYRQIRDELMKRNVSPHDIPPELWKSANTSLERVQKLAREYDEAETPAAKSALEKEMQELVMGLKNPGSHQDIYKAGQEVMKNRILADIQGLKQELSEPTKTEALLTPDIKDAKDIGLKGTTAAVERDQNRKENWNELKKWLNTQSLSDERRSEVGALQERYTYAGDRKEKLDVLEKLRTFKERIINPTRDIVVERTTVEVVPPAEGEAAVSDEPLPAVFRSGRTKRSVSDEVPVLNDIVNVPTPEDVVETFIPKSEGTQKEWRERLREAVGKVVGGTKEVARGVKEKVNWWKSAEESLIRRSAELDAKAEKIGWTEGKFRKIGEWYNSLGWKSKLAVGLALGVGFGISSAVMLPEAMVICAAGIAAQRTVGLSSMFLKYEKGKQDEKWGKEKAMGKAMLYTAGMTGAMMLLAEGVKEGVQYAQQHHWGERMNEWLGNMLGHHTEQSNINSVRGVSGKITTMSEHQPAAAAAAGETAAGAPPHEIPSVGATKGEGSEYMMKRLWEHLHDAKHPFTPPENLDPQSNLARLLAIQPGDEAGINQLVHKIAEQHGFYHADGTNARIDTDSVMSFDKHGDVTIDGVYETPNDGPTTPAYHPEVSRPDVEGTIQPEAQMHTIESNDVAPDTRTGVASDEAERFEQAVPAHTPFNPPETLTDETNYSDKMAMNTPEVAPEMPTINSHGVEVFSKQPHLYAGAKGEVFVSGGQPAGQEIEIREYLKANSKGEVIGTNITNNPDKIRLRWFVNKDGDVAVESAEPKGWWNFSKLTGAPKPDEFVKLIK